DGNSLYCFVDAQGSQDIWMTQRDEAGEWGAPERLGSPFNNSRSNQVFTVMKDGTLFIKGGKGRDNKGFSLVKDRRLTELKVKDFEKMNQGRFYGATMSEDRKQDRKSVV